MGTFVPLAGLRGNRLVFMGSVKKPSKPVNDPLLDADLSAPFFELPELEFPTDIGRSRIKGLIILFVFTAPILIILVLLSFFIFSLNGPQRTPAIFLFGASIITTVGFAVLARHLLKSLLRTFEISRNYLKQSEEQFRLLANSIPDLVSVAKGDGRGLWYNDAWYRYTGSSPQDSDGINWKHIHHPDYFPQVFSAWETAVKTGKEFEMQFPLKGADGRFRRFLYRATPIKNSNGKIFLWFGTATDIENEMIRRDDFLSIASHEIKTPLTTLNLQIQLLERSISQSSENFPKSFSDSIVAARVQMNRIIHLINSVLDLTQLRLGTLALNPSTVDLTKLTQEVCNRFQVELENRGIILDLISPPSVLGSWDPVRIDQILTNLISNAIKYGNQKPVKVIVSEKREGNLAIVAIEDEGDGISPKMIEGLFNRYHRAQTTSKKQGLGLGLYISQQLATAHGGSVSFEPRQDKKGTRFILSLPTS